MEYYPAPVFVSNVSSASSWGEWLLEGALEGQPDHLGAFFSNDHWKNELVLTRWLSAQLPFFLASWLRNFSAGILVYFGSATVHSLIIYWPLRHKYFSRGGLPTWVEMEEQMWVSIKAMFLYTLLPTVAEWFINRGFTFVRPTIESMGGWEWWAAYTFLYLFCVEFMIYWAHRWLHEIKWLYNNIHYDHHIYTTSLSPFAGLAFHPVDGIIQAMPYVLCLFLFPVHYWTFEIALFLVGVWAVNIHDAVIGKFDPIMGSAYHALHHTKYTVNYGQYTIFWDWVFGTLDVPDYDNLEGSMQAPPLSKGKKDE